MASPKAPSLLDVSSADRLRIQTLKRQDKALTREAQTIVNEIQTIPLVREQVQSRKARLEWIRKERGQIAAELIFLSSRPKSRKGLSFEPVTISGDWFIGYVEELVSCKRKRVAACIWILAVAVAELSFMVFLATLEEKIFWGIFGGLAALFIGYCIHWNITLARPHSVFKGTIPVKVLDKYAHVKVQGFFDDIVVASPDKKAFEVLGVKTDPIMLGVIFSRPHTGKINVRFNEEGNLTNVSQSLEGAQLYKIASWDTPEDMKHRRE